MVHVSFFLGYGSGSYDLHADTGKSGVSVVVSEEDGTTLVIHAETPEALKVFGLKLADMAHDMMVLRETEKRARGAFDDAEAFPVGSKR